MNNRDFAASKLSPEDLEAARIRAAELYEEIQQRKASTVTQDQVRNDGRIGRIAT